MNVQTIRKFLQQFKFINIEDTDRTLIVKIKEHFKLTDEDLFDVDGNPLNSLPIEKKHFQEQRLTLEDFYFLRNQFEQRSKKIKDTDDDYCVNEGVLNQIWVNFALIVAESYSALIREKTHYIKILFSCTNNTDYITRQEFNANSRPTDYFWGKESILFYKKSFIDFVQLNENLVIYRSSEAGNYLCPLSLDELERIRRPKINQDSTKAMAEVDAWTILKENIFPKMKRGEVLGGMLALLLELVNDYYRMSAENRVLQHTKQYKSNFNIFIERKLYELELEPLNNFYGTEITLDKKVYYLVEILLNIRHKFRSEISDLTDEMNLLSKILTTHHKILTPIHHKDIGRVEAARDINIVRLDLREEAIAKRFCLQVLISILNTDFNPWVYFSPSISFWDIKVVLPREIAKLYQLILRQNDTENKPTSYVDVAADVNKQALTVTTESWLPRVKENFRKLTRTKNTKFWLDSIRDLNLPKINGYWFSTSQILKAVLNFSTTDQNNIKRINSYIDLLLKTFCQKGHQNFDKEIRVNYHFVKLFHSLSRQRHRDNLMLMLEMYEDQPLEQDFLVLCQWSINRRLRSEGYQKKIKSPSLYFFTEPTPEKDLFIIPKDANLNTLHELVQYYRQKLPMDHLSYSIRQNILQYLNRLIMVIPSQQELENFEDQRMPNDYIADPTS